jgi:hypothetical protein
MYFLEPPIFTLKPEEFYQKAVGNDVIMSCDGIGQPKPIITWRKVSLFIVILIFGALAAPLFSSIAYLPSQA